MDHDDRSGIIKVMGAVALVLGIVSIVGSTVAILTAEKLNTALDDAKAQHYADDMRYWHERIDGCHKSRGAIQQNTREILTDARIVSKSSSSAVIRRHYAAKARKLEKRLPSVDPKFCKVDYPRPPTPAGLKRLP